MIYRSRLLVATIIQCQSPRTTNISSSYKHGALNNTNGFRYLLYSAGPKVEEPLRSLLNCCCLVLLSHLPVQSPHLLYQALGRLLVIDNGKRHICKT